MDSFEQVVGKLLEHKGFWVRNSVKVHLTDSDKKKIGRVSNPRWELDIVAYNQKENEIWIVECKSYLDSGGVSISAFNGKNPKFANRFKLFNEKYLYPVIKQRLIKQLLDQGACRPKPKVKLLLVAGKIAEKSREELKKHFEKKGHLELWDENTIYDNLVNLSNGGYDDTIVSVVSKMLLRKA